MQIGIVLASNALFLISYTFALSWLSFGINGYTIVKHKVPPDKIKEYVENHPFFMRFWYMYLSEDKFHKDPTKTLQTANGYYVFWDCLIGIVFLLLCLCVVVAIMLFSIRIQDSLTVLNCILIICVFFGGIGWVWYQNNKLIG